MLVAVSLVPVPARSSDTCSRDALQVDGAPVAVTLCVPAAGVRRGKAETRALSVNVTEVFAAGTSSFTRTVVLDVLDDSVTSRTIDDVPLQRLGIAKTLHLTIGYRDGSAQLEHALLIPGAVTLK
jgi:hypothetical protein